MTSVKGGSPYLGLQPVMQKCDFGAGSTLTAIVQKDSEHVALTGTG